MGPLRLPLVAAAKLWEFAGVGERRSKSVEGD